MPTLRVATLNLYGPPYRTDERAELVAPGLARLRPHIVGLQEVNIRADIGTRVSSALNVLTTESPFRILHVANPGRKVVHSTLAVITNLPVLAHDGTDYLTEGLEMNRMAQRVRVDAGGQLLDFYNTHFHYQMGPEADETRCEQARKLLAWMDSHGWDIPKVLVGDFNAWPDSPPIRLLKERFVSAYEAAHGEEPEKTWPTPMLKQTDAPDWTLDYIFVSPGIRVAQADLTFTEAGAADSDLYASDHFGLAATLDIE
jgi:endonuclease/exonuclease/phosphatase family metal-dependent hydrolase